MFGRLLETHDTSGEIELQEYFKQLILEADKFRVINRSSRYEVGFL